MAGLRDKRRVSGEGQWPSSVIKERAREAGGRAQDAVRRLRGSSSEAALATKAMQIAQQGGAA